MLKKEYDVFISYSHGDCGKLAPEIQKGLERIGVSRSFKGKNRINAFRDETNLSASPTLWPKIEDALRQSQHLLLLASPLAAKSRWVEKELEWWLRNNGPDNIFIVVAKGEIRWNISKNDFDNANTDCIPASLYGRFTSEPHWIDLREFNTLGHELSYKEAGFQAAIVKVIAAIRGVQPRDVDSEERKIASRATLVRSVALILITVLSLLSLFIYTERKKEELVSRSSNIWAAGDRLADINYSKALRLYAYAYALAPDTIKFNALRDYYEEHMLVKGYRGENDTINMFVKTLPPPGQVSKTIYQDSLQEPSDILWSSIALKYDLAVAVYADRIDGLNLKSNTWVGLQANLKNIVSVASNEKSDYIYLLSEEEEKETTYTLGNKPRYILSFSKASRQLDTLWHISKNATYYRGTDQSEKLPLIVKSSIKISDDGKHLMYFQSFANYDFAETFEDHVAETGATISFNSYNYEEYKQDVWILDIESGETERHIFTISDGGFFGVNWMQLSPENDYIYLGYEEQGSAAGQYRVICDLINQKAVHTLYHDAPSGATNGMVPSAFCWLPNYQGFLYGRRDGMVICEFGEIEEEGDDYLETVGLGIGTNPARITALTMNEDYFIAGAENGTIIIWDKLESAHVSMAELRGSHSPITTIQLPSNGEIDEISIDASNRLAVNAGGDLYYLNFKKFTWLSEIPEDILNQIDGMDIDDLTVEEKKELGIDLQYRVPQLWFSSVLDFLQKTF